MPAERNETRGAGDLTMGRQPTVERPERPERDQSATRAGRQENTHLTLSAVPRARFRVSHYTLEIPAHARPDPARRSTTVGGLKRTESSSSSVFPRARRLPRWIYALHEHTDDLPNTCTRSAFPEKKLPRARAARHLPKIDHHDDHPSLPLIHPYLS
jgi:hypothetical protein